LAALLFLNLPWTLEAKALAVRRHAAVIRGHYGDACGRRSNLHLHSFNCVAVLILLAQAEIQPCRSPALGALLMYEDRLEQFRNRAIEKALRAGLPAYILDEARGDGVIRIRPDGVEERIVVAHGLIVVQPVDCRSVPAKPQNRLDCDL
jgi:hypothetical protein